MNKLNRKQRLAIENIDRNKKNGFENITIFDASSYKQLGNTVLKPQLGFNIKSLIIKNTTLFNPGNTTNFIYEITGKNKLDIKDINSIKSSPFITNRIKEIYNKKLVIKFYKIQSDTLQLNLQLIDSDLPKILSELLLIKYSTIGNFSLSAALKLIKEKIR